MDGNRVRIFTRTNNTEFNDGGMAVYLERRKIRIERLPDGRGREKKTH
jgi:hypothetical protein